MSSSAYQTPILMRPSCEARPLLTSGPIRKIPRNVPLGHPAFGRFPVRHFEDAGRVKRGTPVCRLALYCRLNFRVIFCISGWQQVHVLALIRYLRQYSPASFISQATSEEFRTEHACARADPQDTGNLAEVEVEALPPPVGHAMSSLPRPPLIGVSLGSSHPGPALLESFICYLQWNKARKMCINHTRV